MGSTPHQGFAIGAYGSSVSRTRGDTADYRAAHLGRLVTPEIISKYSYLEEIKIYICGCAMTASELLPCQQKSRQATFSF